MEFISLIPEGRKNAIKRRDLVNLCIASGLVKSGMNADREMRRLLELARQEHTISCLSDGKGYFIPLPEDIAELEQYINQENSRAIQSFRNVKIAKALLEDYRHGRVACE